jgi:hypothetical protein
MLDSPLPLVAVLPAATVPVMLLLLPPAWAWVVVCHDLAPVAVLTRLGCFNAVRIRRRTCIIIIVIIDSISISGSEYRVGEFRMMCLTQAELLQGSLRKHCDSQHEQQ